MRSNPRFVSADQELERCVSDRGFDGTLDDLQDQLVLDVEVVVGRFADTGVADDSVLRDLRDLQTNEFLLFASLRQCQEATGIELTGLVESLTLEAEEQFLLKYGDEISAIRSQ